MPPSCRRVNLTATTQVKRNKVKVKHKHAFPKRNPCQKSVSVAEPRTSAAPLTMERDKGSGQQKTGGDQTFSIAPWWQATIFAVAASQLQTNGGKNRSGLNTRKRNNTWPSYSYHHDKEYQQSKLTEHPLHSQLTVTGIVYSL
jgi:hypothetical protein